MSAALAATAADCASTQNYPHKLIRLVVPFTTSGGNDLLARIVGKKLSERWKQPVIIDNRPGGGASIGAGIVAKAPADGYTILFVSGSFAINPSLHSRLPFNTAKDFAAVTWISSTPNFLLVNPALPVRSVKDLIMLARSKPGQLNFASNGVGSTAHLYGELFKMKTGVDIVHVAYKGASESLPDLFAGRVSLAFMTVPSAISHVKAGKLRALAINGTSRSPEAPDVPTLTEGGIAGFETGAWYGIVAPAHTPKEIINKLSQEIVAILRLPDVKDRIANLGAVVVGSTPEVFDAHIKAELTKWAAVVKAAGIPVEE